MIDSFKSCDPNNIRSIRRAIESTVLFEFNESSYEKASEFFIKIQAKTGDEKSKLTRRDVKYYRETQAKSVGQCDVAYRGYQYLGGQYYGECWSLTTVLYAD